MKKNKTEQVETFETFCPLFPGFYGTHFEYDNEDSDIDWYNEENKTNLTWDNFEWDYADYHQRVSKAFVNKLESELQYLLPVKFEFEELRSPKEYNFRNDSINIKTELNLRQLIDLIRDRKDKAADYFKDTYTSCDGFISFHSSDITDWLNEDYIREKSSHRVGALLDCLCSIELDKDDIIYWADGEQWIDFSPKNVTV